MGIIERSKYLADKLMYILTSPHNVRLDVKENDWEKIKWAYIDLFGEGEWQENSSES